MSTKENPMLTAMIKAPSKPVVISDPERTMNEIVELLSEFQMPFTPYGLMVPVFTPLNPQLTVNYEVIPEYAKYLANAGIKSVLVEGTTGEHMTLSPSDRRNVIEAWVDVSKPLGLHIQVQVGGEHLTDVIRLARQCQKTGVHSLLILPELNFKPSTVEDLLFYISEVAYAASRLPVLYCHIPGRVKVEVDMPAFIEAATVHIPNFRGLKFTSNDLSEGAQVLESLQNGQVMFLDDETLLAPAALLGIRSSIGTTFNLFPKLAQEILTAVENNQLQLARQLQEKLSLAIEAITSEGAWVPTMKAGMEIVSGIVVGPPSLPQRHISAEAKQRIRSKLQILELAN